jgi:hypothetical protein
MEESMKKIINQSIIFLVIVTLIVIPFGSSALAQEFFESTDPEGGEMIYDTVVLWSSGLWDSLLPRWAQFFLYYPFHFRH